MLLNLDWGTIAIQVVNFLVLAGLLYYLLFRPISRRIRERRAEQEQLRQELSEKRQEAEQLRAEWEERLADVEKQADEVIAEAREEAAADQQEMLDEAEEQVQRILSEARSDAEEIRHQAVDEFYDDLLEAILDISAQTIRQAAPTEVHDGMVEQLNDRIWQMGHHEMEQVEAIRRSLSERTPTAHISSARPLSSEQQQELARTLTALADRNVDLEMSVDPALGVGIRVHLADVVVDNSVAGRLEDLRDEVSEALKERVEHE